MINIFKGKINGRNGMDETNKKKNPDYGSLDLK